MAAVDKIGDAVENVVGVAAELVLHRVQAGAQFFEVALQRRGVCCDVLGLGAEIRVVHLLGLLLRRDCPAGLPDHSTIYVGLMQPRRVCALPMHVIIDMRGRWLARRGAGSLCRGYGNEIVTTRLGLTALALCLAAVGAQAQTEPLGSPALAGSPLGNPPASLAPLVRVVAPGVVGIAVTEASTGATGAAPAPKPARWQPSCAAAADRPGGGVGLHHQPGWDDCDQ